MEIEADFVPFPRGLQRSTKLAGALGPRDTAALQAARLIPEASVTLIQTQKQAQPLLGLS